MVASINSIWRTKCPQKYLFSKMIALVLIFLVALIFFGLSNRKPRNFPPGPPSYPLVGSSLELKDLSRKLGGQYLALSKLSKQYNTNILGLKLGMENVISIFSYDLLKKIASEPRFDGRPQNFFIKLRCMGTRAGITSIDGPKWSSQRSFLVKHLRKLGYGSNVMEKAIREELLEITKILDDGNDVTIAKLLANSVLNILFVLISGSRISREGGKLEYLLDLLRRRSRIFDMTGGLLNAFPFLRFVCPEWSGYNLIVKINKELRDFFLGIIRDHHEQWVEGRDDDFIHAFISEMKNDHNGDFTEDQLVMICYDILVAGSETTSNTLDFALLNMILNPTVQKKVQKCIDEASEGDEIRYADRYKMPYVEAVLHESERLCTIVPVGGPKRVLEDVNLEGFSIPKDTTVLLSHHSVHRSEEIWGDPEVFRPERFLTEDGGLHMTEKLVSFGIGRRRCLGEDFARTFIFLIFTGLLREYTIVSSTPEENLTIKPVPGISSAAVPYRAKFIKRTK